MRSIVMEFNELSPVLMSKFIAAGKLPNFARMRAESQVYITDAQEEQKNLEPWIQWITVHSGLPFAAHGIETLGEGQKLAQKNVWDLLSDAGKRVLVCGSMNIDYRPPLNGWVIPDPWATDVKPYPEREFLAYHRFVATNVQEYTREDLALSKRDQAAFVAFMARHGLSPATTLAMVRQLIDERSSDSHWKRAVILDKLQFDLFRSYWKRKSPDFGTFFLNSTAHFQHVYWRNMEPQHFKIQPDPNEQAVYQDAILFGYEQMDKLCGRMLRLAGDDTTLVFATALSQQPCLTYEETGGKVLYRTREFASLLGAVGVDPATEAAPIMAEEFRLVFETEEAALQAATKLEQLRFDGEAVLNVTLEGTNLRCGCRVARPLEPDAELRIGAEGRTIPFSELFYRIDIVKSGMHHPDGMLWIRTPNRRHSEDAERVPLTAIAPTLLDMHGVSIPDHMNRQRLLTPRSESSRQSTGIAA